MSPKYHTMVTSSSDAGASLQPYWIKSPWGLDAWQLVLATVVVASIEHHPVAMPYLVRIGGQAYVSCKSFAEARRVARKTLRALFNGVPL